MSKDNIQTETSNRKKMKPQELSVPTLHAAENHYGHTTILLAAEGEGASALPHVVLRGWASGVASHHSSCRFPSEL